MRNRQRRVHGAILALALSSGAFTANADQAQGQARTPLSPLYREECGNCHVPYAPRLLPAASWQRLLSDLSHHFGTDASLDPAAQKEIGTWLQANAGTGKRARETPPQDRITRAAWFIREHDELSAATWKLSAVKTPSNCGACHTQADQGDFSEHRIKIPR